MVDKNVSQVEIFDTDTLEMEWIWPSEHFTTSNNELGDYWPKF